MPCFLNDGAEKLPAKDQNYEQKQPIQPAQILREASGGGLRIVRGFLYSVNRITCDTIEMDLYGGIIQAGIDDFANFLTGHDRCLQ